jgi:hypothetical protein
MHRKPFLHCAAILLIVGMVFGADDGSDIKIIPHGFAYYQIGQIEQMTPPDPSLMVKMFDQHFNGRLTLEAIINKRLRIIVGGESELSSTGAKDISQKIAPFVLKEAQGIYSFGDIEKPYLQIAAGYFPYKYNPESSNLGEYLFRSGAYPGYVITDFDFAKARLMGFDVSCGAIENLSTDLLFTSEYREPPFFDYSLSGVAGYKLLGGMLDFGAGINFNRLIAIVPSLTTNKANVVLDEQGTVVYENGDTLYYTKKGIKAMGRLTFDPKSLLPFADMFGKNDCKLYGEMAILGFKNYGQYYSDISQRMPIMAGFNIPCFKALDIISFEMEYYKQDTNYIANMPNASTTVIPADYPVAAARSFFKWSFYGVKTITKGLAIKGLIGRDHFRSMDPVGNYDPNEHMNGPGDWHYKLRIMYSF